VAKALEAALGLLVELGATTVAVKVPPCEHLAAEWAAMCSAETAAAHGSTYPSRASEYGPALAALIEQGRSMGSAEIEALNRARRDFTGELEAMLAGVDGLLIPTIPFAIPTLERMGGRDAPRVTDLLRYTAPFDVSGSPTLTLPNGLDRRGLPLSMQLVGRRLSEAMLMRIGHAYQANTDWHRRTPLALAGTAEPQGEGGALSDATS
jgi:amidase